MKEGEEKNKTVERGKEKKKIKRSDVGSSKRRSIEISLLKSDLLRTHTNPNVDPYIRTLTRTYIHITYIHIHKHTYIQKQAH